MHQMRRPYEERESSTTKWIIFFVLLSLLAHVIIIAILVICSIFIPKPKFEVPKPTNNSVTLSLMQAPPQQPPQKKNSDFFPTKPDPNAKPDPHAQFQSDNDSQAKSESKEARDKNAPLPDVNGKQTKTADLNSSPVSLTKPQEASPATPPTPQQQQAKPEPPQPQKEAKPVENAKPTPKPSEQQVPKPADQPVPKPTEQQAQKPPPTPSPKPQPQAVVQPPQQQVDPNGLPVLPPIDAPTMAPPPTAAQVQLQQQQQQQRKASAGRPPPSFQADKADIAGSANAFGANSVAANATPLGRYKALIYQAVGSRWYAKVGQCQDLLPVGAVRVQYTVYFDGTVKTKVLDSGNSTMQMLLSLSINSITESAPFPPFPDALRQQVGTSFTDEFSFSVY
jgi:hypothetical protein